VHDQGSSRFIFRRKFQHIQGDTVTVNAVH
jgi:hypothetical protein